MRFLRLGPALALLLAGCHDASPTLPPARTAPERPHLQVGQVSGPNFVPNAGFESLVYKYPTGFPTWYTVSSTPDRLKASNSHKYSPVTSALEGRWWLFLWSAPGDREAEGVKLIFPLLPGKPYQVSFWAATDTVGDSRGTVRIHLAKKQIKTSSWGDLVLEQQIAGPTRTWHRFSHTFIAEQGYTHLAVRAYTGSHVAIDSVSLRIASIPLSPCSNNLVAADSSFEKVHELGGGKGWYTIFGSWDNELMPKSAPLIGGNIVSFPHSGAEWVVLRSYFDRRLLPDLNWVNNGMGIALSQPMVVGHRYRLRFWGATRDPVNKGKGEIRWRAHTAKMKWDSSIGKHGDIDGDVIVGYRSISGTPSTWQPFEATYVATKPYTDVALQTGSGFHVAVDDACVMDVST